MSLVDQAVAAMVPRLPRVAVGVVARRYISGETLESALEKTALLNEAGMTSTIDVLGENIASPAEAAETVALYRRVIARLHSESLRGHISVKLTHLGLRLDPALCYENVGELVVEAAERNLFVRIDMEDSSTTDATLEIYRKLRESRDNVGVVLQSYLKRSEADARELAKLGANVRICKGIYREPPDVAFQDGDEINRSFLRIADVLLGHGCFTGIATHDHDVVRGAYRILEKQGGCEGIYEFQMLLGVREALRDDIVAAGHPLRVYIPFGKSWYDYSIRRLKENPKIAGYVFRALLGFR